MKNLNRCGEERTTKRLATSSVLHTTALWPSLVHALSPPTYLFVVAFLFTFLPNILTLNNSVIPVNSSINNKTSSSLKDSQNASFTDVINRHLRRTTTAPKSRTITVETTLSSSSPSVDIAKYLQTEKHFLIGKVSRRHKRSGLFGRKRQNTGGHLLGVPLGKANHTGPPPNYLEQWTANPNYWIPDRYHENAVCLLATFSGIVRIRPANSTFRGGSFSISPEESLGRRANCERNSRNMFWKFSQSDEREVANDDDDEYDVNLDGEDSPPATKKETSHGSSTRGRSSSSSSSSRTARVVLVERSNRLLSAGFHVVGSVIEFHVAYIECLQQADKNVINGRYRVYGDGVCVNLSVSFDMGSFGERFAYECNYIWGKTLKDVHYNQNRRYYAGEVQISLKTVRIDKDPLGLPPYSFRKSRRRCAWDSVLSWQSISITLTLLLLFVIGFFALCVCSNSNCSSDDAANSINWCLCFLCCRCCRRRRRALPSRPLVPNSQPPNRPTQNHSNHSNYRSHAPPPPPPPPAPPSSSMSSSRNANTYSRKPTFSTTSYSYDGNGSNPTGQSSSAMSTALETDDESVNGGSSPAGDTKHVTLLQNVGDDKDKSVQLIVKEKRSFYETALAETPHSIGDSFSLLTMIERKREQQQQKLQFYFISTTKQTCQQPIQWHLREGRLLQLLKCQWFRKTFFSQIEHEFLKTTPIFTKLNSLSLSTNQTISNNKNTEVSSVSSSELLYLYLIYWQLKNAWEMAYPRPTHLRDLPSSSQCPSPSAKFVTCHRAAYHRNATLDLLSPSL